MFLFDMLIQGPFRPKPPLDQKKLPIGFIAFQNWAIEVSIDLLGWASVPPLFIDVFFLKGA
jgi:hypothetical protein